MLFVNDDITIADWELTENFVRSSGPGGQNVNKVSTAVKLRFTATTSPNLPDRVKARLRKIAGRRMNSDGVLIINCEEHRQQSLNRETARQRLIEIILEAAKPPPPRRIPTKPSYSARNKRMDSKTQRGAIKKLRQGKTDF